MQRTRERGSLITKAFGFKQYRRTWNAVQKKWNPETLVQNTTQSASLGKIETITDVYRPAPKKRKNFADVLPVDHTFLEMDTNPAYAGWWYVDSSKTTQHRNVYESYGVLRSYAEARIPVFPSSTSLPNREALDQFNAGGVATETSLPNFLLELGEIKGLLTQLNPKRIYDAFRGRTPDQEVSSGFLAYNFGIKPLLGDLAAIGSYTINLQKRLEWLLSNRGKTVSLDFRKTLSTTEPANTAPPTTMSGIWTVWQSYTLTYHAFCRWKVDYDPVAQAFEKLRYFNRYFGTTKLLTAAWEAIPYSFVVDWVTNLGSLFRQFELPSTLRNGITGVGYSLKQTGKFKVYAGWHLSYNPEAKSLASNVTFKRYRRRPGLPISIQAGFDLTSPTGRQQALAMALAHGKFR